MMPRLSRCPRLHLHKPTLTNNRKSNNSGGSNNSGSGSSNSNSSSSNTANSNLERMWGIDLLCHRRRFKLRQSVT